MSERTTEGGASHHRPSARQWLLLRANRWLLTGCVLLLAFVLLVAISQLNLTPLRAVATEQETLDTLFAAFIGAIITGTAIVVTINQLVLSQELGAVGDQRERMQESLEFQQAVEKQIRETSTAEHSDTRLEEWMTSPPEPAAFLRMMLSGLERQAEELQKKAAADTLSDELSDEIGAYTATLTEEAQAAGETLDGAQFGSFDVIWGMLQFNYSWYLSRGRQLQREYEREVGYHEHEPSDGEGETVQAFSTLIETLTLVGPAREHFKTLYFQWELIDLSRALLVISVPALVVMGSMILYVDETTLPGTLFGIDNLVWLSSAAFTVGICPFVVFILSLLRISTVAKQTLAMGPFILRDSRR